HNILRLSQYLCGCDHCPRVQSIQAAYGKLSFPSPSDDRRTPATHRAALLRVLRGCATYDETKALDPALFFTIENLLHDSDGDEDAAFRWVIAHRFQSV
uniref:Uncharacterized protein n=1 Tax=Globisporangium ultimum (strain ATCC 200006 / CBS 805.95 / DAOM BR144) TaxID=431595 RepID=K3X7K7_GLOUD